MPRPRIHDLDQVLDAAESLAVQSGPAAVTIRAVAATTGASNGAIYHSFGSRGELLGRAWHRAATRFMTLQADLVDHAAPGVEAVIAAADAPAAFAEQFPASARLMFVVSKQDLIGDIPEHLAGEIAVLEKALIDLMIRLATQLWHRGDRHAVDVITACIVDLPTALLLNRDRLHNRLARQRLQAAVRAVLEIEPDEVRSAKDHGRV